MSSAVEAVLFFIIIQMQNITAIFISAIQSMDWSQAEELLEAP